MQCQKCVELVRVSSSMYTNHHEPKLLTSIIDDKKNASSNWQRCRIKLPRHVPTSNQSNLCVMKMVVVCFTVDLAQLVVGINLEVLSNVYLALMLSTSTISKFESSLAAGFAVQR
jgi:hypothetical protein